MAPGRSGRAERGPDRSPKSAPGDRSAASRAAVRKGLRRPDRRRARPQLRRGVRTGSRREDVPAEDRRRADPARCGARHGSRATLRRTRRRLERERLALALAVGAAERRIFFSYPAHRSRSGAAARAVLLRPRGRAIGRGPASRLCRACAAAPRRRRRPASAGRRRPIPPPRSTTRSTISPSSDRLMALSDDGRRPGALSPDRQSVSRPRAPEPATSAGARTGRPPMGCSVGRDAVRAIMGEARARRAELFADRAPELCPLPVPLLPAGRASASRRARCRS